MIRSLRLLGAAAVVAALSLPSAAGAQTTTTQINGSPLVISSDETGRIGVAYRGATAGEFFGSSLNTESGAVTTASNSGFGVVVLEPDSPARIYAARFSTLGEGTPSASGSGTAADPFRLTTVWTIRNDAGGPLFELKQELFYENGAQDFRARYELTNISGAGQSLRAATGVDLAGGGSDRGSGLFSPGPPRFVGGYNDAVGSIAGVSELTQWSHFEEGRYFDVLSRSTGDPRQSDNLLDVIDPNEVDNGVAVQWDQHANTPLAPGQTATFEVLWRFRRTFAVTPQRTDLTTGETASFDVSLTDLGGSARSGVPIRWSVLGVNRVGGSVTTGADGRATFEYIGGNPGDDLVTVYADANGNNVRDEEEPERQLRIAWTGPDAPTFAQEVNLAPVAGVVRVRLPRNAKAKGAWAEAAQSGFVPLRQAQQVPINAEIDARRGRVRLTSSAGPQGGVQSSEFYSGRFKPAQSRRGRGLTELTLSEPLSCSRGRGKVTAAAVRSRRLWGRGRGRFRTRGRYSSATVRGTTWLTKDTCTTTTTTVREGVVIVRDQAKRRNVRVRAGRKYVARARRR